MTQKYRPEIDGLRAIAVISVILFHAGFTTVPGGFVGVDIFFVISGYLITQILSGHPFSILQFYERRIRRTLPALMVMMLIVMAPGYALMLPDDLENLGQSLVATTLFANNILLLMTSGYFAEGVEFKPLMHTWSIGVEIHYYIVAPLLMMVTYRLGGDRATLPAIVTISLISFLFCLYASEMKPDANFYLIFSRAWELGAGAIVALIEPNVRSRTRSDSIVMKSVGVVALLMTIAPMFWLSSSTSLPSWPTLIPVIGAAILLLVLDKNHTAGRLLALPPLVGLGLISYSAYLYHQPVFAFTRLASLKEPSATLMVCLIPVILVLAYLSWRFVETPFRNRRVASNKLTANMVGASAVVCLAAGLAMHFTAGFYRSWPELAGNDPGFGPHQNVAFNMSAFRLLNLPFKADPDQVKILVIGNSFARDFINMGIESGRLEEQTLTYSDIGHCVSTFPPDLENNIRQADFIVLASGVDAATLPCAQNRIAQFRTVTMAKVLVIGTKNFGWNNNAIMLLPPEQRYSYRAFPSAKAVEADHVAANGIDPDVYIDLLRIISDGDGRVPVFTPDHKFISQDREHLTRAGAKFIGNILFEHPALKAISLPKNAGTKISQNN
ncbi:acyltransferase family protein [Mesorhizobium sp.]|uniref:acyltransferase family protein n=1 Tax=Mesorhizobium sp. TaxID=1871066 RepID=UPI000FE79054|nr:acyltransferase family protein [Mesorhizobium sp.]RWQ68673.1 MAG: acyltransferase [Mesorhizobium sp.]